MANYDDVFYNILLRLPSKSLVRFKSLSREWNFVISDPRFGRSHIQRTSQGDNHSKFIIFSYLHPIATLKINDSATVLKAQQIHCPYKRNPIPNDPRRAPSLRHIPYFVSRIAHCDGLLCLVPSLYTFYQLGDDNKIVVWNPLTMQHKIFPRRKPNRFWEYPHWETFGFGYDSVVCDYKIVHVMGYCYESEPEPPKVRSLSLKLGSWELAQMDIPYSFSICQFYGPLVNGCLYWICEKIPEGNAILCFDLHKGRLREETSLSSVVGLNGRSKLGLLNKSLYLANDHNALYTDIWTMIEEDDVLKTKCWIKTMRIPSASQPNIFSHSLAEPILITRTGLVLTKDRHLTCFGDEKDEISLFNPTDESLDIVAFQGVEFEEKTFEIIPYVESIVSP